MKRQIGEKFKIKGIELEVAPKLNMCNGCYYFSSNLLRGIEDCSNSEIDALLGDCGNVIFKQVKSKSTQYAASSVVKYDEGNMEQEEKVIN